MYMKYQKLDLLCLLLCMSVESKVYPQCLVCRTRLIGSCLLSFRVFPPRQAHTVVSWRCGIGSVEEIDICKYYKVKIVHRVLIIHNYV